MEFDPTKTSYEKLLNIFWDNHHCGFGSREKMDTTDQYRSAIFTDNDAQQEVALASRARGESGRSRDIMTAIEPLKVFWAAEEYHQRYFEKDGGP